VFWEDAARLADALGPAARRDLLRVLTSPSEVRADAIRQLHERPDGQEMADLLIFLEGWEWARQRMIEELSGASRQRVLVRPAPANAAGRLYYAESPGDRRRSLKS
jgi:hypothetical protein